MRRKDISITDHMNTTTLKTRLEGLGPEKELLCLIIGIFAVRAATAILNALVSVGALIFSHPDSGNLQTAAVITNILDAVIMTFDAVCAYAIYARILTNRKLAINRKGRIGVIILCIYLFLHVSNQVCFQIFRETYREHYMFIGFYSCFRTVIYIIGLFMFINGCDINARLRRFIKWTPFIGLIISFCWAICSIVLEEVWGIEPVPYYSIYQNSVNLLLPLIFLFIVQHLSGIRVSKRE